MSPAALPPALVAAFTAGEILWIAILATAVVLAMRYWGRGSGPGDRNHPDLRESRPASPQTKDPSQDRRTAGHPIMEITPRPAGAPRTASRAGGLILWLAQGFGSGRLKPGPGTWGSVVGMLWTLALLAPGWPWAYALGALVAIGLAVPVCTEAGRHLGDPDPGSVVLDEIVAVPLAFAGYAGLWWWQAGELPAPAQLRQWWPALLAAFALFRLFDIWKPWPIRALQRLPGGWGVVLDDVAAGLVAAGCLWGGTWAMFWYRLARG